MTTTYASGKEQLSFSSGNVGVTTGGSLGVSGTYFISIQGQNLVGLNLNSALVSVSLSSTSKITITFPILATGEYWKNIVISASTVNDAEQLTQILSIPVSDIGVPLELTSSEIFKLTTSERTVANPASLPTLTANENGIIRYVTSLGYYYQYDRYSTKTVDNTTVLSATTGRWLRVGDINTYIPDTTATGGCDVDVRTPNLVVDAPSYAVDGSKGVGTIYYLRNDFTESIPSGTQISGLVRLYEEDKSQLFSGLLVMEILGYVDLTTAVLDTSPATGEILYSPTENTLFLNEDLEPNHAVVVQVSPKFRIEYLNNQVPYLANLGILLEFAPNVGSYAYGSKAFGNLIYAEYDRFKVLPNTGLTVTRAKGSGLVNNYELNALAATTISLSSNIANQYIYMTNNGSTFASTTNPIDNTVVRCKVGTVNAIGEAYSYGSISLDNTKQLSVEIEYPTTIRADYPDLTIAGETATLNAATVVIYLENSSNVVTKSEQTITPAATSDTYILTDTDFVSASLPVVDANYGLFAPEDVTPTTVTTISGFTTDTYTVYVAFKYTNVVTVIDHSVSEFSEGTASIGELFDSATAWGKSLATVDAARALLEAQLYPYQARYIVENNRVYRYNPTESGSDDGINIIKPTALGSDPGALVVDNVNDLRLLHQSTNPTTINNQIALFSDSSNLLKYREETNGTVQQLVVLNRAQTYSKTQSNTVNTLTINTGVVTADLSLSNLHYLLLTSNVTNFTATNLSTSTWVFYLVEDTTGGRTLTFDASIFKFSGTSTITTTANTKNRVSCTSIDGITLECKIDVY